VRTVWLLGGPIAVLTLASLAGCGTKSKATAVKSVLFEGSIEPGAGDIRMSIYAADGEGWRLRDGVYSSPLGGAEMSPGGAYYIYFGNFVNSPDRNPLSVASDWAISISNQNSNGNKKANALRFCSNQDCSASDTLMNGDNNSFRCSQRASSETGRVFLAVRDELRPEEGYASEDSAGALQRLDFHDLGACLSNTCDRVFDVLLETCDGKEYQPIQCSSKGDCRVTVVKQG
jgi:hypothetical protein